MEVDLSRLSRDYKLNPLRRGETIPREDLEYLLVDARLTLKQIATIINRHPNQIGRQCKEKHVYKNKHIEIKHKIPKILKTEQDSISNVQNLMINKFNDVIIDYKQPPFIWDFYIPSKDLYISYNIQECHGGEPFNEKNLNHWEKIKYWATEAQNNNYDNQQKNYFANLINTWTIKDVLKRQTAQHNNLNFIEFFTEEQFLNWCEQV